VPFADFLGSGARVHPAFEPTEHVVAAGKEEEMVLLGIDHVRDLGPAGPEQGDGRVDGRLADVPVPPPLEDGDRPPASGGREGGRAELGQEHGGREVDQAPVMVGVGGGGARDPFAAIGEAGEIDAAGVDRQSGQGIDAGPFDGRDPAGAPETEAEGRSANGFHAQGMTWKFPALPCRKTTAPSRSPGSWGGT